MNLRQLINADSFTAASAAFVSLAFASCNTASAQSQGPNIQLASVSSVSGDCATQCTSQCASAESYCAAKVAVACAGQAANSPICKAYQETCKTERKHCERVSCNTANTIDACKANEKKEPNPEETGSGGRADGSDAAASKGATEPYFDEDGILQNPDNLPAEPAWGAAVGGKNDQGGSGSPEANQGGQAGAGGAPAPPPGNGGNGGGGNGDGDGNSGNGDGSAGDGSGAAGAGGEAAPSAPPEPGGNGGGGSSNGGGGNGGFRGGPPPEPPGIPGAPAAGGSGNITINCTGTCIFGDPHIISADGVGYDFQAVGEFHLAMSEEHSIDIQVRFAPTKLHSGVTVMTAIAAQSGENKVTADVNRSSLIEINGEPVSIEPGAHNPLDHESGVYVFRDSDRTYGISFPNNLFLVVVDRGSRLSGGINTVPVAIEPIVGLGGVIDGDAANDFTTRGGAVLKFRDAGLSYNQLYRHFGNSWRISNEESLFSYLPGETTDSHTDLTFPEKHLTLADLDPEAYTRAEKLCREQGIKKGPFLNNCIYDVGFTQDDSYTSEYVGYESGAVETLAMSDISPAKSRTVVRSDAVLRSDNSVVAGSDLKVTWSGPGNDGDYIVLAKPEHSPLHYETFSYLSADASTVSLRTPGIPGNYELRYILNADKAIIATEPVQVTPATASLDAEEVVNAGSVLTVNWTGPANDYDYIALAKPGTSASTYENFVYLDPKNAKNAIRAPGIPGNYELRYILNADKQIIASISLQVVAVKARLEADGSAAPGSEVTIVWEGPGNDGDYITLATNQQESNQYETFKYVERSNNTITLTAPDKPGTYEIRYILSSDAQIIGSRLITVLAK